MMLNSIQSLYDLKIYKDIHDNINIIKTSTQKLVSPFQRGIRTFKNGSKSRTDRFNSTYSRIQVMKPNNAQNIYFITITTLLIMVCYGQSHWLVLAETYQPLVVPKQFEETKSIQPESLLIQQRVPLPSGLILEVANGCAVLRGADGEVLARNSRVVRSMDPDDLCPADGFVQAKAVDSGFELQNQLCSGWFLITEIMTFAPATDGYVLAGFSAVYIDRRTAEPVGPPRILTPKELGVRPFSDLNPDDLYLLLK
jgi:hypothetical protein